MKASKPAHRASVASRKAVKTDLALIRNIEVACFNEHDRFKNYQIRRFLKNPSGSLITDLILYRGHEVGWASYFTRKKSRLIRLYSMCILPEFSGKGIATSYLSERMMSLRKFSRMALEVRKSNRKAIGLYKKLGFTVANELHSYYPDGETALRMERELK